MEQLHEGQQFILGTRRGMLRIKSAYDRESSTWTFFDLREQPIFQLGSTGQLIPVRDIGDSAVYTLRDLHEWGNRA